MSIFAVEGPQQNLARIVELCICIRWDLLMFIQDQASFCVPHKPCIFDLTTSVNIPTRFHKEPHVNHFDLTHALTANSESIYSLAQNYK